MKRKKYKITIKMIKVTTMEHEQESMKRAKGDIKRLIETSGKEVLEQTFNSKPKFIYKIEMA